MKLKCRGFRAVAAILTAAVFFTGAALAAPSVSAQSAVLYDCSAGRVLWEKDGAAQHLIASTTKIMTGLLICEQCNPAARVRIPAEAVGIEGSSMYLKAGEVLTVRELLYGLMLQSGNDAAMALAIFCSGNPEDFAALMNEKAARLGLKHTHFANPHGLDDAQNYATAEDLAALAAYALENPLFREIVSTRTITVGTRTLVNHNKLLWRYAGAVGVKTGYTRQAGRLLVSAAERDGRRLVAVTMNAPDDWRDHAAMLDYGFAAFTQQTLIEENQMMGAAAVISGAPARLCAVAGESFSCALLPDETPEIRVLLPRMCYAPVRAGERAGTAEILLHGRKIGAVELFWKQSAELVVDEKPGLLHRLFGG